VTLRLVANGTLLQFKILSRSAFDMLNAAFWPLVFATIAYYLFHNGNQSQSLFEASLGATVMTMWATVGIGASGAIQWQRRLGTLELLMAAPTPFIVLLAPLTISFATLGIYSLVATLLWGRFLFGMEIDLVHPVLFVLSLPAAIVAIGMLGLLVASVFVLYRSAVHLGNSLEYPIWLVTGLLIPLTLLPGWVTPISWLLAPTWGMRALRESAIGGEPLQAIGMCLAISVAYSALAVYFLHHFERLARDKASFTVS
jgi:ABC-2 type transport system permease protein